MTTAELYAASRTVPEIADCHFDRVVEIPGYGYGAPRGADLYTVVLPGRSSKSAHAGEDLVPS